VSEEMKSLDQLSEELNPSEVQMIAYLQGQQHLVELQKKMEGQVPDQTDLISQYTELGYVAQDVEVAPGMTCKLRTLPPFALDQAVAFARSETRDEPDNYPRILARRRLAYALIAMNGRELAAGSVVDTPLVDLIIAGANPKEQLRQNAEKRYEILEVLGLSEKISEAFGIWERVIFNRINGIEDLSAVVKKSTGDTASEQSAQ